MLQDEKIITIVSYIMKYTDAHCHITPNAPCPDVLAGRICNATNQSEWNQIITSTDDKNFACIGIHPWNIESVPPDWAAEMRAKLAQNPMLMIGEIGLDKYHPNMATQEQMFVTQLQIASEFNRPIHLHCVGAWDKILHIFKELHTAMPPLVVAHAFNGDVGIISQLADKYNTYFSYHTPTDAKAIGRITATPMTRLLAESDAYDNDTEIQVISDTFNVLAEILGQELDAVTEQIYQNFQKVISYARPID